MKQKEYLLLYNHVFSPVKLPRRHPHQKVMLCDVDTCPAGSKRCVSFNLRI